MTQLLSATGGSWSGILQDDDAIGTMRPWAGNFHGSDGSAWSQPKDDVGTYSYKTGWWPGMLGVNSDTDGLYGDIQSSFWYEHPEVVTGHAFRYGFRGISRDQFGSPLPGAVLKLFRTLDDTLQDTQTSAADGSYLLSTIYIDAHYVVAQYTSAPPTAGATLNTLIPTT